MGKKSDYFVLSLVKEQKDFLDEMVEKTSTRRGLLIFQAVQFAKNKPISVTFMNNYINFIYDKRAGVNVQVQKVVDVHDSLKKLSEYYKLLGFRIGIKGVAMLYLLNYAKNYLNLDINRYENFTNFINK